VPHGHRQPVMKATRGKADATRVRELIMDRLG
jgi:Asp-tRNA(Asn)/Glu-tRNA(Gln) amidotransferase B subunit